MAMWGRTLVGQLFRKRLRSRGLRRGRQGDEPGFEVPWAKGEGSQEAVHVIEGRGFKSCRL
jgi:hypothetical protein